MREDVQDYLDWKDVEIEKARLVYVASPFSVNFSRSDFDSDLGYNMAVAAIQASRVELNAKAYKQFSNEHTDLLFFFPVMYTADFDQEWKPLEGWYRYTLQWLMLSKRMRVLGVPGWEESYGVQLEISKAKEWGIPITYYDYDAETGQFVEDVGVEEHGYKSPNRELLTVA